MAHSTITKVLTIVLAVTVTACASTHSFDRGQLRNEAGTDPEITDQAIADAFQKQPQLPEPFRLAVYFPGHRGVGYGEDEWRWSTEDKNELLDINDKLKSSGIVSDVFLLSDQIVRDIGGNPHSRKRIRLAAARAGADAILIIRAAHAVGHDNNNLAYTYVLLLPALFVPATETQALFLANASLWDVRNDFLYLGVQAEGTATRTRPGAFAFTGHEELINRAKTRAVAALRDELEARIKAIGRDTGASNSASRARAGQALEASRQ